MFAVRDGSGARDRGRQEGSRLTSAGVFVQSAGVCPSSLQLTETLMMVKGPPALLCP